MLDGLAGVFHCEEGISQTKIDPSNNGRKLELRKGLNWAKPRSRV
jgi:hypothetical protein